MNREKKRAHDKGPTEKAQISKSGTLAGENLEKRTSKTVRPLPPILK